MYHIVTNKCNIYAKLLLEKKIKDKLSIYKRFQTFTFRMLTLGEFKSGGQILLFLCLKTSQKKFKIFG